MTDKTASTRPSTLGDLRASGYRPRSVADELRENLRGKLGQGAIFQGILGYEDTVVPQVVNALLAKQSFILLGTRGQAKTRLLRGLTDLLDPAIPILADAEIPEDPLAPITTLGKNIVAEQGDAAAVRWLTRAERYVEKLATPDTTIADIIGDIDPIKAAQQGIALGSDLAMQFGLLPRANRGIFAINELPDLAAKIQVGLFNILEEGDVQIKGFPVRLPLDVVMVFSANPEDYTARGKIITPLKDRIGAEVRTHYPQTLAEGTEITRQEAWADRDSAVFVSDIIREVVEAIAFAARDDRRIDKKSGVSQRLPITLLELAVSNAERRALLAKESMPAVRILDLYAALPAITGKLELEYEGEQIGSERIARDLIRQACATIFAFRGREIETKPIIDLFRNKRTVEVEDGMSHLQVLEQYAKVPGLLATAEMVSKDNTAEAKLVGAELVLEGLYAVKKLSRSEHREGVQFSAGKGGDARGRSNDDDESFGNLN